VEKHDVVVVGAGPAGLTAAKILAENGKDVLVLEKLSESEIGNKVCGGAILNHQFLNRDEIPVTKILRNIKIRVFDKKIDFEPENLEVLIIERKTLGQYQLKKAKQAGAEIKSDVSVSSFDRLENYVQLSDGIKVGYDYLIGADGSNSVVRKGLGYNSKKRALCIAYSIPRKSEDFVMNYNFADWYFWYSWIIPHGDYTSVGVGFLPELCSTDEIERRFNRWAEKEEIDLTKGERRAASIYFDYHGFRHGNVFLTGDAASFASSAVGEGIPQAIRSGEIAAKAILDPSYNFKRDVNDLLRYHRHFSFLLTLALDSPAFTRKVFEKSIKLKSLIEELSVTLKLGITQEALIAFYR
jgi:geranylgeranyl reductase